MTKNTCYFTLHQVWNIDLRNAENSIPGPLDFKIFWGTMPLDPPRGSCLRPPYLITPHNKYFRQYEHPSKNLSDAPAKWLVVHSWVTRRMDSLSWRVGGVIEQLSNVRL